SDLMRRRSGCGTNSMSCSCSKLKIEASRATRRITLRMMIGIKLRIDVLFPTSTGLKIMPEQTKFRVQHSGDCACRRNCDYASRVPTDPPPLKWSDLRYVFDIKEDCNGKEAI